DVCTLFWLFGGKKWKYNVEVQMVGDEYLLKICFLSLPDNLLTQSLHSYAGRIPDPFTKSLGVQIPTKQINMDNNNIKLILVDISTDPVFEGVKNPRFPNYIRGASAAVFAFSKSNNSFVESTIEYYHEFRKHIPDPTVPVAFIGLHDDDPETVTLQEGQSIAQELGADYFEMAATDLQALDRILRLLVKRVIALKTS
ncbi:MAG: hypothetical protein JSW11_13705, partial [Candidatus Heimdallarchaeota archaeon]